MAVARFYLYREKVILPTVVQAEAGFYMDARPVKLLEIKDGENVKIAIARALESQNRQVPTPGESHDGGSVLLDALSLKRWSSFEQFAVMYTVHTTARYTTIYVTGRGSDGMWSQEATRLRQFHPSVPVSVLTETIMQEMAKQPEARPERFGLAVIPKTETNAVAENGAKQT
jgi:hypothetical protein